jgi:thiosulfate/3-mercaptopyruvate sulfurtransferase
VIAAIEHRDARIEQVIGKLLRAGLLLAAGVVLLGAIVYLATHGFERRDYHAFQIQPARMRAIGGVVNEALSFNGAAIIQLGVLMLIATPIARVASSAYAFARQGDRRYVVITLLVLAILSYGLFVQPAHAATACGGHGDKSTMLVTTAWLADHLKDSNLVILAIGQQKEYDAGHIPGSLFMKFGDLSAKKELSGLSLELPPMPDLVEVFEKFGVANDSRIVLYPTKNGVSLATRAYLTLDAMGLGPRTSLLDGGFPIWQKEGRPVSTDVPTVKRGKLEPCAQNDVIVDLDYVRGNLHRPAVDLLDVRDSTADAPYYSGAEAMNHPGMDHQRSGHIPGAKSLPMELLIGEDGRLKPREELQALFDKAGVKRGDRVVSYCWIGQRATLVYFAARYLGYDARLYDGSWEEWNRHTELPTEMSATK